jgi:hypothetical protein
MASEVQFSGPVEWMGIDPHTVMELEVSPPGEAWGWKVIEELRRAQGVEFREYGRKGADLPTLFYLAGATHYVIAVLVQLWELAQHKRQ